MKRQKKILFVHHPFCLGGSAVSLLYLLEQLDPAEYEPVVACLYDAPEIIDFYRSRGYPTVVIGGEMFSHTTAGWWPLSNPIGASRLLRWLLRLPGTCWRLRAVLQEVKPDLVHLNSLTVAPFAPVVETAGIPTVLHVRESVHLGHFGLRRGLLRAIARRWCREIIYICEDDRQRLTGASKGIVVYNFVDFERFDSKLDARVARARLGIEQDAKVVLYVGGASEIKGVVPLLVALQAVKKRLPSLVCLMPGAEFNGVRRGLGGLLRRLVAGLGWRSDVPEEAGRLFDEARLGEWVRVSPFSSDMPSYIAASDLVVFPSIEPHFARPVMEAAVMAKPVVASDIGGVREIVEDGVTGLLVPPGDAVKLAAAICRILEGNPREASRIGMNAHLRAREIFDAIENARRISIVYERVLSDGRFVHRVGTEVQHVR